MKVVSVVATVDTDAVTDKSGKITKPASSVQVRLDPKDKAVQALIEKALKDED